MKIEEPEPIIYTVKLTADELDIIAGVLGNIAGTPQGRYEMAAEDIYQAISGVRGSEHIADKIASLVEIEDGLIHIQG